MAPATPSVSGPPPPHSVRPCVGERSRPLTAFEAGALGALSGVFAKTLLAPTDRIRLALHVRTAGEPPSKFKSIFGAVGRVYTDQGLGAFWRGNLSNCVRFWPTPALNFAVFNTYQQMINPTRLSLSSTDTTPASSAGLATNFLGGAISGVSALLVTHPIHSAQVTMMMSGHRYDADGKSIAPPEHYRSGSVRRFLWGELFSSTGGGLRNVYRHFAINMAGSAVYRGCYFGLYETLRSDIPVCNIGIAYGVTLTAGMLSYPLNVVARRMSIAKQSLYYNSNNISTSNPQTAFADDAFGMARHVANKDGWRAFWRGSESTLGRSFLGAFILLAFDCGRDYYLGRERTSVGRKNPDTTTSLR